MLIHAIARVEDFDGLVVTLSGRLDEHASGPLASVLTALQGAQAVAIDLGELTAMNSPGTVAWVSFLERAADVAAIELRRCPSYFMDYANVMPGMTGESEVVSAFFPVTCASCGHAGDVLVKVDTFLAELPTPRLPTCRCGAQLEPQVPPEEFVTFVKL